LAVSFGFTVTAVPGAALFQKDAECHAETGKQDNGKSDEKF
jgi:hypothetical protein